jgi:hypothetical protein
MGIRITLDIPEVQLCGLLVLKRLTSVQCSAFYGRVRYGYLENE